MIVIFIHQQQLENLTCTYIAREGKHVHAVPVFRVQISEGLVVIVGVSTF